jgi:hypothetical protein
MNATKHTVPKAIAAAKTPGNKKSIIIKFQGRKHSRISKNRKRFSM